MSRRTVLLTVVCCCVAGLIHAQAPLKVGDELPIEIVSSGETGLPGTPTDDGMVWQLVHPGASYLALHFAEMELPPGMSLRVADPTGEQAYVMTGRGKMDAGTFWAQHIKGDTLILELKAGAATLPGEVLRHVFRVDGYAAGHGDFQAKAICSADDKQNAACYENTHPGAYDAGRAVARLLIGGTSLCTGWLASGDNHLITNEHCITSSSDALNTDYEFMAEAPNCSDSNCQLCYPGAVFSGASFIQDSADLDYALVQISSGDPAATYGFMEIDSRDAVVGEQIFIPQHPGGNAKEFAIESSSNSGGLCVVDSVTETPCSGSGYYDVGYMCDTEGGSSGSPVLATSDNRVIALHHCAYCPNRGVPIDLVYAEISSYLGSCGDGACSDSEDPCSCPSDCGTPPTYEDSCSDGVDNDCDGAVDCNDADCAGTVDCPCDGDGVCELGEDCDNCPSDCISGSGGAVCGNGVCEAGDGEDCTTCAADCNGLTTGKPSGRYCCGADTPCSDDRCTSFGLSCTTVSQGSSYCCGDGQCTGDEDATNCALDCEGGSFCGDGTCDAGEDSCSCPSDCGAAPVSETGLCTDGLDNDCDGAFDCSDSDCDTDPACSVSCAVAGDPCTSGADCCSGSCHPAKNYCR